MTHVLIYKRFERFWHWMQALLVILMALTGFSIHYNWNIVDFQLAVTLHNWLAWVFVGLIVLAIFWHFTTGEWKQYLALRRGLGSMLGYYISGIFKGEPHPVKKTRLSKLNPLQCVAYLGLKILVIPVLVTTGFLYYFYNDWSVVGLAGWSLEPVALIHTLAAFTLIAFMFAHTYLTTTGRTAFSNLKAMITGWEALEHDDAEESAT